MATLSQARKTEIAKELRTVATWVAGPREAKVLALAAEIEGTDDESGDPQLPLDPPGEKKPKGS